MLMGEFQHSIDNKGRIIVPAKFRDEMGSSFVLTKGLDNCLFAYPQEEWDTIVGKLRQLSFTKADARAFSRFFFSGADEVEMDKQGRVLVAPHLRQYAALDKDIVIIGVSSRMEVWDKNTWERYCNSAGSQYEEIAEKVTDWDLGI